MEPPFHRQFSVDAQRRGVLRLQGMALCVHHRDPLREQQPERQRQNGPAAGTAAMVVCRVAHGW
jgi:hypothetical protein